jgi:penicillin-binding protein activator
MKKIIIIAPLIVAISGLTGCAGTRVQYGDAQALSTVSTDFGSSDLQQIAASLVDSMLTFPPVVEETSRRRPVLVVDRVKNKTMQHIDTESITDSIRARMLKSGKFRFIDRTTDSQAIDEVRYQQESGLVKKGTAMRFGQQLAPEYMLTANFSEIEQRNSDTKDVYYKFTMNLKNLSTGILEWSDEKEIRKVATRSTFGY